MKIILLNIDYDNNDKDIVNIYKKINFNKFSGCFICKQIINNDVHKTHKPKSFSVYFLNLF